MLTRYSIVTLVFFILSTIFVIRPWSFHVQLPFIGRRRFTVGLMTAPILAIAILWAAQCMGPTQIRHGIAGNDNIKPYNILILFVSLAYMAITLDATGALRAAAFWVSNKGGSNGRKLYFYFYLLLTALTVLLGNDAVILSGTVFLVYYTEATGLNPEAWLIAEFAAANTASMVLFVGNITNVVVCEGFRINNALYTAYTVLPFLACSVACYLVLLVQFRSSKKHVPRKLEVTAALDPREALRDPVSAVFGTIWILVCLAVVIVLSFFHVDVWIVVLPFACGKIVFDLAWDHYRYVKKMIPHFDDESNAPESVAQERQVSSIPAEIIQKDPNQKGSQLTALHKVESSSSSDSAMRNTQTPPPQVRFATFRARIRKSQRRLAAHFPTFFAALPRLPLGLVPFSFAQFILIEALADQGWIAVFSGWLVTMTGRHTVAVVWIVGVFGVLLCNVSGTNIGATILLTKVVRASKLSAPAELAAAIALAVASNIGAVSFTYSASLAGLLWDSILRDKGISINQWRFAVCNILPLVAMTGAGLAVVTAMMVVLY